MKNIFWVVLVTLAIVLSSCGNPASTGRGYRDNGNSDNGNSDDGSSEKSGYIVVIKITSNDSVRNSASAYVYNNSNNFVSDAIIKIDGKVLELLELDQYHLIFSEIWKDGSKHSYSIHTPDGKIVSGEIYKPIGKLTGVVYSPTKSEESDTYKISAPAGGWPTGSYIKCEFKDGDRYLRSFYEVTVSNAEVTYSFDSDETDIEFKSMLINKKTISGYSPDSYISVTGDETKW